MDFFKINWLEKIKNDAYLMNLIIDDVPLGTYTTANIYSHNNTNIYKKNKTDKKDKNKNKK